MRLHWKLEDSARPQGAFSPRRDRGGLIVQDRLATISTISLFSFGNGNSIAGNMTGLDVTIDGHTQFFSTVAFGPSAGNGFLQNELIDLSGSQLAGLTTNTVTLSNFVSTGSWSQYSTISEIQVQGNAMAVPEPASFALLGIGLAGFGFVRRRKAA